MYFIINIDSKQYIIKEKKIININKINIEKNKIIIINKILLIFNNKGYILKNNIKNIFIICRILKHIKKKKINIFKKKKRNRNKLFKNFKKKYTKIYIEKFNYNFF